MKPRTEFDKTQFDSVYPEGIQYNYWNIARNQTIYNVIKKYQLGEILDIGSGRGIVTDYLYKQKVNIQGVELGDIQPMNNSTVQIHYKTNVFEFDETLGNKIKCVSFFDVLEHLEDPVEFLKRVKKAFKNLEYLIITVPACDELWTNFDEYCNHYKRYSMQLLQSEVEEAGFKLIFSRYFFHTLYIAIMFTKRVLGQRAIQFKAPGILTRPFHFLLGQLFYWERHILPSQLKGSSLILVARVNQCAE